MAVDLWSIGILTYELLSGDVPFKSSYLSDALELILAGNFTFPEKSFHTISTLAKDFIKRLLKSDPKIRLSAKEALNHPWLFVNEVSKKVEKNEKFPNLIQKKKPSILTISALNNRIPSIDDIEIQGNKPGFSKFKEKMSVRGLDLHVHTIENKRELEFRTFSPRMKVHSENSKFSSGIILKKFKTGKSIEEDEEEKL